MPSTIVLDTNALISASGSTKPLLQNIRELLDASARGEMFVVIPEIVVRESVNNWAEAVQTAVTEMQVANRALRVGNVVADDTILDVDVEQARADENARVRQDLANKRVAIPALPSDGHDPLVGRALRRQQPFDAKGKDGYRDALLWESVLELVRAGGDVILVSQDKDAFYDRSPRHRGLARALKQEAIDAGGREDSVEIVETVARGIDRVQEQLAAELAAARAERHGQLEEQREFQRQRLAASHAALVSVGQHLAVNDALDRDVHDQMVDALTDVNVTSVISREYDIDVYEARVEVVEFVLRNTATAPYLDDGGLLSVSLHATATVAVALTADPATIYQLDRDDRFDVYRVDLDGRIGSASTTMDLHVVFDAVFERAAIEGDEWRLGALVTLSEIRNDEADALPTADAIN